MFDITQLVLHEINSKIQLKMCFLCGIMGVSKKEEIVFMAWSWWVIIVFVALCIVNKLCEDNPGFRHVLCCIIALVYPIMAIINVNDPDGSAFMIWALLGPIVLAFYKYVYGIAEMMENDGSGDFLGTILASLDSDEVTVISIIISVVISVVFAAIPIGLTLLCAITFGSKVLACVVMFVPFVYCLICAVRFFRDEY